MSSLSASSSYASEFSIDAVAEVAANAVISVGSQAIALKDNTVRFGGRVVTYIVKTFDNVVWALNVLFCSTISNLNTSVKSTGVFVEGAKLLYKNNYGASHDVLENVSGDLKGLFGFLDVAKFVKTFKTLTEVDKEGNFKLQACSWKGLSTLGNAAADTTAAVMAVSKYVDFDKITAVIADVKVLQPVYELGLSKVKDAIVCTASVFTIFDAGSEIAQEWAAGRSNSAKSTEKWKSIAQSLGRIGLTAFKSYSSTYGYAAAGALLCAWSISDLLTKEAAKEREEAEDAKAVRETEFRELNTVVDPARLGEEYDGALSVIPYDAPVLPCRQRPDAVEARVHQQRKPQAGPDHPQPTSPLVSMSSVSG